MSQTSLGTKMSVSAEKLAATREWLERQQMTDTDEADEMESLAESSIVESSDGDYETETETDLENTVSTTALGTRVLASGDMSTMLEDLKELLNSINSVQTVDNVIVENSSNVHIGNVTNINGNIQIIQRIKRKSRQTARQEPDKQQQYRSRAAPKTPAAGLASGAGAAAREEREERVCRDAFIDRIKFKIPKELCAIIPRSTWLAQVPMDDYEYLQEPVKYVIVSHTATESSEKQAINIRIIRDIQCFHIESREWNDIAYNFLVGCDGNVYEGRGWGVVGAHTMGYNVMSLGITFIGCFMRTLPTEAALNACKNLLKRGVEKGHIDANYKLICHCQCRSTESPGRKLYEEIQKWKHFYNIEEEQ